MKIFHFSIRVLVFGCALLLGTTAVIASRFVYKTIVNVIKPAVTAERLVPQEETAPLVEEIGLVDVQDTSSDFDPTGAYSLDTESVPKAFADIELLEITTREYTEADGTYSSIPVVPSGAINTKKSLQFKRIAFGNREIAFETETINGISYKFTGQFSNASEIVACESCEYPADLEGRLIKIKNG